jgi:Protein of unknown function DUF262
MAEEQDILTNAVDQETPLEEKYREQMRQIVSQKIELPISTIKEMIDNQINLNPDFQRRDRWNDDRRSRFIESIIMNVPIPPIFLGEDEYGKYVVLDGRQRLTAIYEFLSNTYSLRKLGVWSELNDCTWRDLQRKKLDRALIRRFIPAVVILKESSAIVKYDVFDRLNTGGMVAMDMEIRNAVYRGEFNKLLHRLSTNQSFRRLWNIPLDDEKRTQDDRYRTMEDLELVLRFFALSEYANMNLRFKDYLSDFMDRRNREYGINPTMMTTDERKFQNAVENSWQVFGDTAFTRPQADGSRTPKSLPFADAVMCALAEVEVGSISDEFAQRIKGRFDELYLRNEEFRKATTSGTNGKGAIKTRIEAAKALVQGVVNQRAGA